MTAVMSNPVFREPETLGGPVREIEFRDAIRLLERQPVPRSFDALVTPWRLHARLKAKPTSQ